MGCIKANELELIQRSKRQHPGFFKSKNLASTADRSGNAQAKRRRNGMGMPSRRRGRSTVLQSGANENYGAKLSAFPEAVFATVPRAWPVAVLMIVIVSPCLSYLVHGLLGD